MFKWINPKVAVLEERLAMLEKLSTTLAAENSTLRSQIDSLESDRRSLLEKIFSITGVSKLGGGAGAIEGITQPQPITAGTKSWAQQRHDLEQAARFKYWDDKKRAESAKLTEELEKDVLGDKNAS
jgi:hypothetical protein